MNLGQKTIHTSYGDFKAAAGKRLLQLRRPAEPLLNDPLLKTIGIGTRIFLGGGEGYIAWHGTQHNPSAARGENKVPLGPAATIAVVGDLKKMHWRWLRGLSFLGYGATLKVGLGIPIPILNEEIMSYCAVRDEEIYTQVVDFGRDYPHGESSELGLVSYAELKSGTVRIAIAMCRTSLSSYAGARRSPGY